MSINEKPIQRIKKSRNDFDMSQRQLFTSSVGQCIPCYYDLLNPGDTVKIDSALLTRTQTLSSNPMTRVQEHIDYFFVPYRRVFSNFGQYISMMVNDVHSPLLNTQQAKNLPSIDLAELIASLPIPSQTNTRSEINSNSFSDDYGVLYYHNAIRLLDMLGYGRFTAERIHNQNLVMSQYKVNPALICAYHAINFDFYRLTDRVLPNVNLSCMDNYQTAAGGSNLPVAKDFLSIYYRPWKRDFYTNLEVSPLFGGYQSANFNVNSPSSYLSSGVADLRNSSSYSSPGTDIPETTSAWTGTAQHVSTLDQLRRSAALERLAQLQRFNDKFWNVQLSALFGLEVPDNYDHVMYLGSHHSNIAFSDVVATASTGSSVLGEIAGKGLALPKGQKPIEFTAKQHGFVMAIYSATPIADYIASGMDRINVYNDRNDFYNPAFDNLGMQPKYYYEASFEPVGDTNNTVLGWSYRWQELKQKPDLVHGAFCDSLRYWVTSRNSQLYGVDYKNYCISPKFLDSIMLVIFGLSDVAPTILPDGVSDDSELRKQYIDNAFGRDPLLHELYFKSIKYSSMSKFSLPSHNEVML